jgi:hypothetical protein
LLQRRYVRAYAITGYMLCSVATKLCRMVKTPDEIVKLLD